MYQITGFFWGAFHFPPDVCSLCCRHYIVDFVGLLLLEIERVCPLLAEKFGVSAKRLRIDPSEGQSGRVGPWDADEVALLVNVGSAENDAEWRGRLTPTNLDEVTRTCLEMEQALAWAARVAGRALRTQNPTAVVNVSPPALFPSHQAAFLSLRFTQRAFLNALSLCLRQELNRIGSGCDTMVLNVNPGLQGHEHGHGFLRHR